MKSKNIMAASYTRKYKLGLLFLFLLTASVLHGQKIDSMVYNVIDPQYIFHCGKATPIDLFKVANMYVSPSKGYWGDVYGIPYNGKAGINDKTIKERLYTDGNIFTPSTLEADTGTYKFYFYFTSAKDYCGITNSTRFVLNLYIGSYGCMTAAAGELENNHRFCYGSNVNMNSVGGHEFNQPVTIADLLLTYTENPNEWKKESGEWLDMSVYTDRNHRDRDRVGDGNMPVDLKPASGAASSGLYEVTNHKYYVVIHRDRAVGDFSDSIDITIYPESRLDIYYSPDIKNPTGEYGMDDDITITIDTSLFKFNTYEFFLNRQNLNKYINIDETKNTLVLNALTFSGVEDFLEIVASDRNNCIARYEDNVIVPVPFPSVFTPDGDGINDVFLGGEKFKNREFHLEVINRWGNRIYYGDSGWDGTYKGNKVAQGTYIYILLLKMNDGTTRTIKGTVALVRENKD
jgi:gliding motility-associated-like protein